MISTIFDFGGEIVEVRIDNMNCLFRTKQYGGGFAPIDGLRIDEKGVKKEFPDLIDNPDWKKIAIERFKDKIKSYSTNKQRMEYIISDLKKWGYKPLYQQEDGMRVKRL